MQNEHNLIDMFEVEADYFCPIYFREKAYAELLR